MDLSIGATHSKGLYQRENKIIYFKERPTNEMTFFGTGTGQTGAVVQVHDDFSIQINHEGAFDSNGLLTPICRLHFDFFRDPIGISDYCGTFEMFHDLSKSVITVNANTPEGLLKIEVRAHMQLDTIKVDIEDMRSASNPVRIWAELPYAAEFNAENDSLSFIHDNAGISLWHTVNTESGMKNDGAFQDILKQRCFGGALYIENAQWQGNGTLINDMHKVTVIIAAGADCEKTALHDKLNNRINASKDNHGYCMTHEKYWEDFWNRVWFDCDEKLIKHMAAYDFYRYYSAVSSGKNREFPLRFQIDLLRYSFTPVPWLMMQIHSIQTIESFYGIYRNGDIDSLTALINYYKKTLPFFKQFTHDIYNHDGIIIPYETNPWGSIFYCRAYGCSGGDLSRKRGYQYYNLDCHKWSMYSFEHGLAIMQFLLRAAKAFEIPNLIEETILPYCHGFITFFLEHYPIEDGKIVLNPATSGETWAGVKNPSSWILLFQSILPQLILLAKENNDSKLAHDADKLLRVLPEPAKVKWKLDFSKEEIEFSETKQGEDVILPAESFSKKDIINAENPELYAVWPYGILGIGCQDFDLTLRTYNKRAWKNVPTGWALDSIWAACLGLEKELLDIYDNYQFPSTVRFPNGMSYEESQCNPVEPLLPMCASMQGMGTSVCHIYEMIIRETTDCIYVFPAWPLDCFLNISFYSEMAGRIEISYNPGESINIKCSRKVEFSAAREGIPEIKVAE